MPHQLNFSQVAEYDSGEPGINVKASLRLDQEPIDFAAKIDTGSTNCIFTREIGEQLGLKIEDGLPKWIGTATGRFLTYEHEDAFGFRFRFRYFGVFCRRRTISEKCFGQIRISDAGQNRLG
jgi:hypothetical protein